MKNNNNNNKKSRTLINISTSTNIHQTGNIATMVQKVRTKQSYVKPPSFFGFSSPEKRSNPISKCVQRHLQAILQTHTHAFTRTNQIQLVLFCLRGIVVSSNVGRLVREWYGKLEDSFGPREENQYESGMYANK